MFRGRRNLPLFQSRSGPIMERTPQSLPFRWIVVLILVCTHTDNLLASNRGPNQPRVHNASHGHTQPFATGAKRSPVPGPLDHPPSVVVRCHSDSMELVVQADLFHRGLPVEGTDLRLGLAPAAEGSVCRAAPSGEAEFTIWVRLADCGMTFSTTEEKIVYSNVLRHSPEPSPQGLLRLDAATIPVECHYDKRYSLSGISLDPNWIPLVSIASAENQIHFDLQLMTDKWDFKKGFYSYFLGDPVYFEVSAALLHHAPLRVYVDHCVATATPDVDAPVRYDFIEHSGCLADAYLTNSSARFLPRVQENKLRFQLDAFRFYQEPNNQVFVTCYVTAVPVTATASSQNRACSFIENRWRSVDGRDQVCTSCDASRRAEGTRPAEVSPARTDNEPRHSPAQDRREEQPPGYYPQGVQQSHGSRLMKSGAQHEAARTVHLGPIAILSPSSADSRTFSEGGSP